MASLITVRNGTKLAIRRSEAVGDAKACVLIVHGMAEHSKRYSYLSQKLTHAGYRVYAYDQRGHGYSARTPEDLGFIAEDAGAPLVVGDCLTIARQIADENPGIPQFLIGHSFGSLVSRVAISIGDPKLWAGAILSGTAPSQGIMQPVGRLIADSEKRLRGPHHRSQLLNQLSFGSFNKAFSPKRTDFDWLSRDEAQVDAYIEDPLCGWIATTSFYVDLLMMTAKANAATTIAATEIPLHFIAGMKDPVGGAKVVDLALDYRHHSASKDVTCKIYPGARHEVFNETNRDEIIDECIDWLDERI